MSYELELERPLHGGIQKRYKFSNGYEASVIQSMFSYGGESGKWELAVQFNGLCVYDTPITDDVLGHLSWDEVEKNLSAIDKLPSRSQ